MSILTWRDVAAPALSGGAQGYQTAGGLLDNATKDMSSGLAAFGQAQQQQAGTAAMANALQYTDPDAYQAALRSGSLLSNVDMTQITPDVLSGLGGRAATLISNASNEENWKNKAYTDNRVQAQNAQVDAAAPILNQISAASLTQDQPRVDKLLADNAGILNDLPPEIVTNALTHSENLAQGSANRVTTNQANQTAAFNYKTGVQSYEDTQKAYAVNSDLQHATTGREAHDLYMEKHSGNLTPGADAAVLQAQRQKWGPSFDGVTVEPAGIGAPATIGGGTTGAPATGGTGGAGGTAPAAGGGPGSGSTPAAGLIGGQVTVPAMTGTDTIGSNVAGVPGTQTGGSYNVRYNNEPTDKPLTDMTIGEVAGKDAGSLQSTMNAKSGHTPVGRYQITQDTINDFAPRLGLSPDAKFDSTAQDKIGQAVFDSSKNGDLTKRWSSLTKLGPQASTPGFFAGVPWDQMKDIIAQHEGTAGADSGTTLRTNVQQLSQRHVDANNLLTNSISRNQRDGVENSYRLGTGMDDVDSSHAVDNAIKTDPAFKGMPPNTLKPLVDSVMAKTGWNATQAVALISKHVGEQHGDTRQDWGDFLHGNGIDRSQTWFPQNLPSGFGAIDVGGLDKAVKSIAPNTGADRMNQTQHLSDLRSQNAQAQQNLILASQNLTSAQAKYAADRNYPGMGKAQALYNQALAQSNAVQAQIGRELAAEAALDKAKQPNATASQPQFPQSPAAKQINVAANSY